MAALLGPLVFIRDTAPPNQITGLIFLLILAPMILSFPIRPRAWSAFLAICGLMLWFFIGVIGEGIDC